MGELVLVTGVGHCGTAWIAEALNHPDRLIYAKHEIVKHTTGGPGTNNWKFANLHATENGIDAHFIPYFQHLKQLLAGFSVVVDSHSWVPALVPRVAERIHVSGVIHLVRNGIQNVYSLFHSPDLPGWFDDLVREQLHFVDLKSDYTDRWDLYCAFWAANREFVTALNTDVVVTLEQLTTNVEILRSFITSVYPRAVISRERLREIQNQDIHRHVMGERRPQSLWKRLGVEQRRSFTRICGPLMKDFGFWK